MVAPRTMHSTKRARSTVASTKRSSRATRSWRGRRRRRTSQAASAGCAASWARASRPPDEGRAPRVSGAGRRGTLRGVPPRGVARRAGRNPESRHHEVRHLPRRPGSFSLHRVRRLRQSDRPPGAEPAEPAVGGRDRAHDGGRPRLLGKGRRPPVEDLRALKATEPVALGRTRLSVTRLGLGTAPLAGLFEAVPEDQAVAVIERSWEAGIRFYDTAPLYGHGLAEMRVGKALRRKPREELTLASKVGRLLRADAPPEPGQAFVGTPPVNPVFDFSYDGAMRSVDESLERLQLGRIDILHIHDPDDHYDEPLNGAYLALDHLPTDRLLGAVSAGMNQAEMLTRFAREGNFDCFLLAGRYTLLEQGALKELLPVCLEKGV